MKVSPCSWGRSRAGEAPRINGINRINGNKWEIYWELRLFTEEKVCAPPIFHPWGFSTPWMLHWDTRQDSSRLGFVWDLNRALQSPSLHPCAVVPTLSLCHSTKTIRTLLNLPGRQKWMMGGKNPNQSQPQISSWVILVR